MRFLFLTIILITYGSLYPLEFLSPSDFSIQIGKLINFRFWNSGIADAVANILLFIPFGIALYHAFKPRSLNSILGLAFITFLFAYLIQFCQIWTLVRIPYGGDAIWNLCGSIIGMILFVIFGKHWSNINGSKDWNRNLPFIIIACFVVIDLQPFIPTFDMDTIKNNLKAMTSTVDLSLIEIVRHALFYIIPIKLWQQAAPYTSSLLKVGGGLAILVFLQLFIVNSDININMLSGAFIAFIAVGFTVRIYSAKTLLSLIITLIVLNALNAMEHRASVPFNWIPFKPALSGNTLVNIFALIEKSLFYFLFFYISSREKVSFRKSCLKLSLIIFTLEVLQTNIQGATPDITENIVVLLIGYITWKWLDIFEVKDTHSEGRKISLRRELLLLKDPRVRLFLMYATVAVVAQMLFMSLPQLPYNIVELYNNGGTFIAFTSLFLAVFVAVAGIVWIAQRHSVKNISDFKLPLYCAYLSMATFLLLKLAVTRESIADINGSSNITYQLTGPRILGDFGYQMVMFFGEQSVRNISQIVEPFIRFATLTGPVLYLLTLFLSFSFAVNISKDLKLSRRFLDLFKSLCFILPWFYLCKLISFDFSSTDNLNELIARDGSWGIGGGGYLYGLLIIIALTVTYNVHAINKKRTTSTVLALITFVLSFPVTWILFKSALVESFEKYGHTFSGVDFILGGSRTKLLPEPELMMRWGLVYLVIIVALSMSIILALRLVRHDNVLGESQSIILNNPQPPRGHKKLPLKFNFNIKRLTAALILSGIALGLLSQTNIFDISDNKVKQITWAANDTNIIFDHHTHTTFSDGKLSIEELVKLGIDNGCDAIAITDHTDSKRSLTKKQLDEIKLARLFNPNVLVLSGAELNPPSYKGREHVNVLFSPSNEELAFRELRKKIDDKKHKMNDEELFQLLNSFNLTEKNEANIIAIYNHPSRKDKTETENKQDFLKWSEVSNVFIGLSGAPGHQKSENVGSYKERFKTINRWDPAIAKVGSTLDQLLDEGKDVWGAIASSDYHNEKMDYPPCGFSRIHVSAPEKTYKGLMTALKRGTFWASHGQFLTQLELAAEVAENQVRLSPGEAGYVKKGDIALIQVGVMRDKNYVGLPLEVELLTNCVTGKPEVLEKLSVPAFKNKAVAFVPINSEGKDNESCYLRSRVKIQAMDGTENIAYSNHIRFLLK